MPLTLDPISLAFGAVIGAVVGFMASRLSGDGVSTGAKQAEILTRLEIIEDERDSLLQEKRDLQDRLHEVDHHNTELRTTLEAERKALEEKLAVIEQAKVQMSDTFKAISQEALNANRDTFLTLAQEKLKQAHDTNKTDMEKRETAIKELIDPVTKSLKTMDEKIVDLEKSRQNAYGELREHLTAMKTDQDKLRGETASLVQALRSPSTRGQWGELQLKRTLEMAGLVENVHFEQQVSIDTEDGRQRPDVIVKLPGGQSIVIDAKAPIEAYLDSLNDGIDEAERIRQLDRHARHVRDHMKQLGSKAYWAQLDTPEFVVMFLPGESYFSAALERDASLLESGVDNRVIPASPTTLISLLKAVAYGWKQEKLTASAREISELGRDMYKRLATFGEHIEKVGKGLNTAMNSYNSAVGSLERSVMPVARKFEELQLDDGKQSLPRLDPLDKTPRELTAPELVGHDSGDTPTKDEDGQSDNVATIPKKERDKTVKKGKK